MLKYYVEIICQKGSEKVFFKKKTNKQKNKNSFTPKLERTHYQPDPFLSGCICSAGIG